MKAVTVEFVKEKGTLTFHLEYEHDSYPIKISHEGDTDNFKLAGKLPGMQWPLNSLERKVTWQAEQMGAVVIVTLGTGKVREWSDNLGEPS